MAVIRMDSGTRIPADSGDYIVLVDYGPEGMIPVSQASSFEEAVESFNREAGAKCLVRLVSVDVSETVDATQSGK